MLKRLIVEALNIIRAASPSNIFQAVTSVPCFEFWLLLHFEFTTKPIVRAGKRSPGDNTKHELKRHLPTYDKGDKDTYKQLKAYTADAAKRAVKVIDAANAAGTDNPSTMVHTLVEFLQKLGN